MNKQPETAVSHSPICFVIAPIGTDTSPTRERSDLVFEYVIEPAVKPSGYSALRADRISKPGVITTQVIDHILTAPLMIADLTELNPNVFYELAVRHAIKKPLIQICEVNTTLPFDVSGMRTIFFDHKHLGSVAKAITGIGDQIKSIASGDLRNDSPITSAIEINQLNKSGDVEQRVMGQLLTQLSEMRTTMETILAGDRAFAHPSTFHQTIALLRHQLDNHPSLSQEDLDRVMKYLVHIEHLSLRQNGKEKKPYGSVH